MPRFQRVLKLPLHSEFLKVASIRPGKVPIQVVVNEMSRRKSPALVGLIPNLETGGLDRVRGEEAFSFAVRYPETSFSRARDLLSRPSGHPLITKMIDDHLLPFDVVPHPNRTACASVKAGPGPNAAVHSAEELVASILQYAKEIAEAHTGGAVFDAVIAVPAFFGQAQRQALIESASLAGLNVMGLINSHAAAALQFGIERDFSNKTQNLILYDMGSGSTEVSLVRFSSYPAKEPGGKATRISQLEVRDVDWDPELGSNLLDVALARHFTRKFADKHSYDLSKILGNQKAMAKMKKQVRRTKEMLSANSNAPFSVEEFYENKDFQSSISREEFEGLVAGFFDRAAAPLLRIIERNGLKPEDIDGVELLGGGSRVPRLQAVLMESLGGRSLDRHLVSEQGPNCLLLVQTFL
jgi:hypoxia up-regulated 1